MAPIVLYQVISFLLVSASFVGSVGPPLKAISVPRPSKETTHHQNVAILEELRTITELVLRSQKIEEPVAMSIPVVYDCTTLREAGIKASGVYSIFPFTFKVYCDMKTDGGGWTVIQRRAPIDIHEDFNRPWSDYRIGFGDLYEEFWLGLEPLHQLTYSGNYELRIDMTDYEQGSKYAHYKFVNVNAESDGYRLLVSNYSGNAGDALSLFHNGRRFSTLDRDQDVSRNKSCAQEKQGGWWFHACYAAHLNGIYPVKPKRRSSSSEIRWWSDRENVLVLTAVEMKIRRQRSGEQEAAIPDATGGTEETYITTANTSSISPPKDEEFQILNETDSHRDYDFKWNTGEDEIHFADPDAGGADDEYNITDYAGRSDISPWWISQLPGIN